jgi:RNA polymerase sigma-70 factor (ECF subfamily)
VSPEVLALATVDESTEIAVVADIDALFRAHYARLVRSLTVVCDDRELAADAVQEAFVKAHLRWRKVRHYDDPIGWVRRVAINQLRDDHRRASRKRRAVERLAARTETATEDVQRDVYRDDELAGLLASLPRQQRLCIALCYVVGLAVADIASTLGISDGAVKYHLHQGRERLRGPLAASADAPADEGGGAR